MDYLTILNKHRQQTGKTTALNRADIPNKAGFKFLGIQKDFTVCEMEVYKNEQGQHWAKGFSEIIGWLPIETIRG